MQSIIIKPLITEKTLLLAQKGVYSFMAADHTNKGEIAADINKLYKVKVTSIRTCNMHGKVHRTGKRQVKVRKPDWKKAFVTLTKGQTIEAFTVTGEGEKK